MSKIQWQYDLVERPFCEQLQGMGWKWMQDGAGGPGPGLLIGGVHEPAAA